MSAVSKTVVFFGSGPVAAESLRRLHRHTAVEAVVTKPRPPHHKGSVPVLETAQELGLKVFEVSDKRALSELFATKPVQSRLGLVIDFGVIIGQDVIDYFPLGIINSHFSLLPQWRGADPITFSVLSGQKTTGVSLMLIVAALDEGPLLAQAPLDLPADITTPILTEKLIDLSDRLLRTTLPAYFEGQVVPKPQLEATIGSKTSPSYSHRLQKSDGVLDWHKPAEQLEREVRAFAGWPGSQIQLAGQTVLVTRAHAVDSNLKPGEIQADKQQLLVGTIKQALAIDRLKPAGKTEMSAQAFIAGYKDRLKT